STWPSRVTRTVGKFSTSRSPTSSAWSSMSIQRNFAAGKFCASAMKPGRYSVQVSHHAAQRQLTSIMADSIHALAGMAGLVALAWAAGEARRAVPWRSVAAGLALEIVLALICLKLPGVKNAFMALNDALMVLEKATEAGTSLVFGYLGGAPAPFSISAPEATFVLAFRALPIVLVISALSALLFYWRLLPLVVRALSWLLRKTMGVGGVVGLSTAANVFVGMVEAPLFVRPYLARVSRGELFAIMVAG